MHKFPSIHAKVHRTTTHKVPYLQEAGVVLVGQTQTNLFGMSEFLDGFDEELGFNDYLKDPTHIDDTAALCKMAGQTCYLSFGPKRSKNDQAEKYLSHIKSSGHGSVFEHANFTFLFYGIDRSVTHELVRHRAGFGFSQVSQRYVNGKVLRFVERPEYSSDMLLHDWFEKWIEEANDEYKSRAQNLLAIQQDDANSLLSAENATDKRKRVNQAARSCLPNEVEAPIVVTANVRGWRHFIEMRCNKAADLQIRALAGKVLICLKEVSPLIFSDYKIVKGADGLPFAETEWRKV